EAVLVERLLEGVDLRPGDLDFRFPDLAEVARRDEAGEQADDHHDHEQLEQRKAAHTTTPLNSSLFGAHRDFPFRTAMLDEKPAPECRGRRLSDLHGQDPLHAESHIASMLFSCSVISLKRARREKARSGWRGSGVRPTRRLRPHSSSSLMNR